MNEEDRGKIEQIKKAAAQQRAETIKARVINAREEKKQKSKDYVLTEIKSTLMKIGIIIAIIATPMLLLFLPSERPAIKSIQKLTRSEKIDKQFSAWDGEHMKLASFIKRSMKDPASYDFISSSYSAEDDYLIVLIRYRGKNSFGAVVINSTKAKVDVETGSVIEIIK